MRNFLLIISLVLEEGSIPVDLYVVVAVHNESVIPSTVYKVHADFVADEEVRVESK